MSRPLRIAMLGCRGVPATFGGVERHVEAIGRRLVERGHEVTVFCEEEYVTHELDGTPQPAPAEHLGMRLVTLPTVSHKHAEALVHSARSTRRTLRGGFDIVHYHAVGPGVFSLVPRWLTRAKVVQTIHGLDAERAKWGRAAQLMLRSATWLSARVPDLTIVVSAALAQHYGEHYRRYAKHIPNGVDIVGARPPGPMLERLGVEPDRYVLYVGRLVPEKCPDMLVRSFAAVRSDVGLVIAGGTSYSDDYVVALERAAAADPRVRIAGFVYGDDRDELYANACVFVLPSALEGLPLTLLEAIGAGLPVIASDIAPHVEVLTSSRPGGRLFPDGDAAALTSTMQAALDHLDVERRGIGGLRREVLGRYNWDTVTDQLEAEYRRLVPT